jgi:hypothetical protein
MAINITIMVSWDVTSSSLVERVQGGILNMETSLKGHYLLNILQSVPCQRTVIFIADHSINITTGEHDMSVHRHTYHSAILTALQYKRFHDKHTSLNYSITHNLIFLLLNLW